MLKQAGQLAGEHRRAVSSAVVVGSLGFAAAAFGIAPSASDPSNWPKQMITQEVLHDDVDAQLEALAEHALELYRTDLTRASDSPDTLLQRLGVSDTQAANFLRSDATARRVLAGRSGKMVQVKVGASGELQELIARYAADKPGQANTHFTRLRVARFGEHFQARIEMAALATQVRVGSGVVRGNSLFVATDEARIPEAIGSQLADIFSNDIDFRHGLRSGDRFAVVYEALTADGEPITWNANGGRVLASEFMHGEKIYSAVWFKDETDPTSALAKGAYFSFDGQSKSHGFTASPVQYSRVTSGFAMRMHPILQSWRQHRGVDFGAPYGTPVLAVGDGVIEFAGWQNGYGNVIEVAHSDNRSTLYAHLSRINVKVGQQVSGGAQLGNVGATGWATGPHLHFEFKVRGVQQDPTRMARVGDSLTLSVAARHRFDYFAQSVKAQLDAAGGMAQANTGTNDRAE